jgi:hypothetical protein
MARDNSDSIKSAEHKETHASTGGQHGPQLASCSMLTTAALIGVAALIEPELLVGWQSVPGSRWRRTGCLMWPAEQFVRCSRRRSRLATQPHRWRVRWPRRRRKAYRI